MDEHKKNGISSRKKEQNPLLQIKPDTKSRANSAKNNMDTWDRRWKKVQLDQSGVKNQNYFDNSMLKSP